MATKQQERQALEQIKNIIEDLGTESYIAKALEGCLEIAAENISNDFFCSMKQRAETAEQKVKSLELDCRNLRDSVKDVKAKMENLESDLIEARNKQITPRLYKTIWENAFDQEETSRRLMMSEADMMANLSEAPQDIGFQQAVKAYRKSKKKAEDAAWIMDQLGKIKPEGC